MLFFFCYEVIVDKWWPQSILYLRNRLKTKPNSDYAPCYSRSFSVCFFSVDDNSGPKRDLKTGKTRKEKQQALRLVTKFSKINQSLTMSTSQMISETHKDNERARSSYWIKKKAVRPERWKTSSGMVSNIRHWGNILNSLCIATRKKSWNRIVDISPLFAIVNLWVTRAVCSFACSGQSGCVLESRESVFWSRECLWDEELGECARITWFMGGQNQICLIKNMNKKIT